MARHISAVVAGVLSVLVSLLPGGAVAEEPRHPLRLAMMDMMPMGATAMPGMPAAPSVQPAPAAGGMGDDRMRMGGPMPGQAQPTMPMGATAMPSTPAAPGVQPAPAAGGMGDDRTRMGGAMPGQAQTPMPPGQAQPAPMAMCPMCTMMMQNMARPGATPAAAATGGEQPGASSAARLEGRIAFFRTELHITDAQAPAWEAFATALRAGREHLEAARAALQDSATGSDPMARLISYETHLMARAEAIHKTRLAFSTLQSQLDDAQKRTATSTMLPFIGAF